MEVTIFNNWHYAINILPDETYNFDNIEQVLIFQEGESDKSKIHKIVKLHKQFGHSSSRNKKKMSWYTIIKY